VIFEGPFCAIFGTTTRQGKSSAGFHKLCLKAIMFEVKAIMYEVKGAIMFEVEATMYEVEANCFSVPSIRPSHRGSRVGRCFVHCSAPPSGAICRFGIAHLAVKAASSGDMHREPEGDCRLFARRTIKHLWPRRVTT
jgi:hypothetical protein